ncbi:MAG: hypothetical protein IJR62_09245 [Lachnospiraceae bacterium]|nr:hypothetical protein [Lachnospiraceae bacterium]
MYNITNDRPISEVQRRYIEALRQHRQQGVKITFDGKERPEKEWETIFRLADSADGTSFYMADYIAAPQGEIVEIRLEKVRVRDLDTY